MINANTFRDDIHEEFKTKFDFEVFDAALNKYFADGYNNYYLGLCYPWEVEKYGDGMLSLVKGKECGYWKTSMQISHRFEKEVETYLRNAGFKTTKKGLCGFDNYDVMVISI